MALDWSSTACAVWGAGAFRSHRILLGHGGGRASRSSPTRFSLAASVSSPRCDRPRPEPLTIHASKKVPIRTRARARESPGADRSGGCARARARVCALSPVRALLRDAELELRFELGRCLSASRPVLIPVVVELEREHVVVVGELARRRGEADVACCTQPGANGSRIETHGGSVHWSPSAQLRSAGSIATVSRETGSPPPSGSSIVSMITLARACELTEKSPRSSWKRTFASQPSTTSVICARVRVPTSDTVTSRCASSASVFLNVSRWSTPSKFELPPCSSSPLVEEACV